MSSRGHWETLQVYKVGTATDWKEMDRQDAAAAKSGGVPEYQSKGYVDMSHKPADWGSGLPGGNADDD